jgi:hypothetical protein
VPGGSTVSGLIFDLWFFRRVDKPRRVGFSLPPIRKSSASEYPRVRSSATLEGVMGD